MLHKELHTRNMCTCISNTYTNVYSSKMVKPIFESMVIFLFKMNVLRRPRLKEYIHQQKAHKLCKKKKKAKSLNNPWLKCCVVNYCDCYSIMDHTQHLLRSCLTDQVNPGLSGFHTQYSPNTNHNNTKRNTTS